jgi:anhydro-N-acetylmuramic acid kinase
MLKLKNSYNVIGVMSGTSLDGVDLCYSNFSYENKEWKFLIQNTETVLYENYWATKLINAHSFSDADLEELDIEYTSFLSQIILRFISKYQINDIDFISSHGHTIFHEPNKKITYQIGNRVELNKLINIPIVCDFRTQDIKLGGQGAPLVPIGDLLLFRDYSYCLNLGGFSNISVKFKNNIIAYDICPVNIVLNKYSRLIGFDFDSDGKISESGKINYNLLKLLNSISFYNLPHPKSLGKEWVENKIFPLIDSFNISIEDVLRTFVEHIAIQISNNLKGENLKILITGGGVKNKFLIKRIKKISNNNFEILSNEITDYKEALIFGFLGVLKIRNENNCLKSVTGASSDHSSGKIFQKI